jgi:hypothetical protein
MAEPVAPLPVPQKSQPIPWPSTTDVTDVYEGALDRNPSSVEHARVVAQRYWETIQRTLSRAASEGVRQIRYLKRERPFQVMAGAGAAAFLGGVAIRLWRSHHE